ncbi:GNAT family N-acetyltransferase [Nocardiopsis sp. YSL2]|uniref:GNAT family N-acetyltransferase n=1 Tax=Nocardiopsis sp. YSL2 TaxID=2939492 RepID=UPI0026F44F8A|nr:GNAT family N-acetyltransferase [Nocardiopsis sp. YSL2]
MDMAVDIGMGFSEDERARVGGLYWEAFRRKLSPAFAEDGAGREFITAAMRPDRVIAARVEGTVTGVCGVHHGGRGAFDPAWSEMTTRLGAVGAVRALLALTPLHRRAPEGVLVLDGICVAQDHRGRGIGSLLLEAADSYALRHGLSAVELSVVDTNPRAEALYRRRGFTPVGSASLGFLSGLYGFGSSTALRRLPDGERAE